MTGHSICFPTRQTNRILRTASTKPPLRRTLQRLPARTSIPRPSYVNFITEPLNTCTLQRRHLRIPSRVRKTCAACYPLATILVNVIVPRSCRFILPFAYDVIALAQMGCYCCVSQRVWRWRVRAARGVLLQAAWRAKGGFASLTGYSEYCNAVGAVIVNSSSTSIGSCIC